MPKSKKRPKKHLNIVLILLMLPTLILVGVVFLLMLWHRPTRVELVITTNRVDFIVGETEGSPPSIDLSFDSVIIEGFSKVELTPIMESAPVAARQKGINRIFPSPTMPLIEPPLVITGRDESLQPSVTIESLSQKADKSDGFLRYLNMTSGSRIVLEASKPKGVCIRVNKKNLSLNLQPPTPFQLSANQIYLQGSAEYSSLLNSPVSVSKLADHTPFIEVKGNEDSLKLCVILPQDDHKNIPLGDKIPIREVCFVQTNPGDGNIVSALRGGEIIYPDFPKIEKIPIKNREFLTITELAKFTIDEITLDQNTGEFSLHLNGIAGTINCGPEKFPKDGRLTLFDSIWQNSKIALLFGIVVWGLPTTAGAYKLYKEIYE